jgi:hypothetical protein
VAVSGELRRTQLDGARAAAVGVLEVDLDAGDVVLSGGCEAAGVPRATGRTAERAARAEQLREEVAELAGLLAAEFAARELKALAPVGRRTEVLALAPVGTELVVGGALLRVLQHLVRFLEFLELLLCVPLLAHVGMVLAGELAIGALDLVLARGARHPHDLVVVLEAHGRTLASAGARSFVVIP